MGRTALALMVFYVFALMCMSTVAVTVREAGGGWVGVRWAAVQFGYMLALAYLGVALAFLLAQGLDLYALVGCASADEMQSNIDAFDLSLSPSEVQWLDLQTSDPD